MTDAETKKPPALRGFLQALQPLRIRGWAYAPSQPDAHLRIEVFLDGEPLTHVIASTHFPDLEKNGIGGGDHGFLIPLRVALPTEEPDRIEVVAIGPGGARRTLGLPDAKAAVAAPGPVGAKPPPPKPGPAAVKPAAVAQQPKAPPTPAEPEDAPAAAHPNAAQYPVFILGAARSGTSAMVKALRQTKRYEGYGEGHFLNLLPKLTAVAIDYYTPWEAGRASPHLPKKGKVAIGAVPDTLLGHIKRPVVMDMLTAGFGAIMQAAHPSQHWFDKTPGPDMIWAAHALARTWPNARFIFMKRRPVDNIESRRRKFPATSFEDNCHLWADCMIAWADVRGRLGKVSIEVDQAQLVDNPAGVAKRVAALLQLDEAQAAAVRASLESDDRPQQTGATPSPALTLATVDWDDAMKQRFRDICGAAIGLYGYKADLGDSEPAGRSERTKRRKPAAC